MTRPPPRATCTYTLFPYTTLCRSMAMIGREDLLALPEWSTVAARSDPNRIEQFVPPLMSWTIERTREELRAACSAHGVLGGPLNRSEEPTSELQSLMRISYAGFCLRK